MKSPLDPWSIFLYMLNLYFTYMDGWFYGKSICEYNIINVHGKIGWSIPFHTPLRKSIKISLSKIHIQIYDRPILIGSNISLPTGCCMKFCKFKHKKQTSTCGNTDIRKVVKSSTISHQISQVTTQVITCDQSHHHHHHHHHHHPPINKNIQQMGPRGVSEISGCPTWN